MSTEDCTSCLAGIRHDHRLMVVEAGGDCAHARSDGSWRPCCVDYAAGEVEIAAAAFNARRGRGPDTPAAAVWLEDPLRAAMIEDPGPDAA